MHDLHQPKNRRWALTFEMINACSWSAVVGAPLMLVLKHLGASATVLGFAVAILPLTGALQLLGARWLPRFGYRRLMLSGWSARTLLAGVMAAVILCSPRLGSNLSLWAILLLLTGFTILRGISSCAWLPWLTQLVPDDERGRYLAWSGTLIQATLILCGVAYSAIFVALPGATGFAVVFAWGCATGVIASWVMSRIPDAHTEAEGRGGVVPWRSMLLFPPFRRLLSFSLFTFAALAALGVLWVPVLRDLKHETDGFIALLPVLASVTQLLMLPLLGHVVDRTGSRPIVIAALAVLVLHALLWGGLAAGLLPLSWPVMIAIQVSAGVGGGAFGLASQRLLMATVPVMGRSHFFALHSVAAALGQGLAPVVWGLALDGLATWRVGVLNAHAALYLVAGLLLTVATLLARHLDEPRALRTSEFLREFLVQTPRRALARLIAPNG